MFNNKKRTWICVVIGIVLICLLTNLVFADDVILISDESVPWQSTEQEITFEGNLACKSAILMEANTGKILYEHNADQGLPP